MCLNMLKQQFNSVSYMIIADNGETGELFKSYEERNKLYLARVEIVEYYAESIIIFVVH